jgi:hypothetical protein
MAGPTYSGGTIPYRPQRLRLFTRQRLESLHGPPEIVETYALADGGWIAFYFYRMPQPQLASLWRRLFHRRERKPPAKQLVPWGFRDGRFAGQQELYKRVTESSSVTLVSTEPAPPGHGKSD